MPRPRIPRRLRCRTRAHFFKPRGIPLRHLDEIFIHRDEIEALKLHDIDGLEQIAAAKKMRISQPTFARTLDRVYKKLADALVNGKAIRIEDL